MIDFLSPAPRRCDGLNRRTFLRVGSLGWSGLGLSQLLRSQATASPSGTNPTRDLSVILVWLDGGPPQHETYDPKPDAPIEYRGPLKAISTSVPGTSIAELLPEHARIMDKATIIRSVHHDNGDHFAAAHWMLTGYLGATSVDLAPQYPSMGSVITHIQGARRAGMPAYVGLPNTHSVGIAPGYHGAAYLGVSHNPFNADGDPNSDAYQVANLSLPAGVPANRAVGRRSLLSAFDQTRRDVDASGLMEGLDKFDQQAFTMVLGDAARKAFDLTREDPRLRDRYGRHQWGQSALLGRRLVESGVRFVTLTYSGWDMHSSLANSTKSVLPVLDRAVGTLIDDLHNRGLLDTTIVLVMGEFGRTPRMNTTGVPGIDPLPGRDHWGNVMSVLAAGGGFPRGRVVGASNARGEIPKDRPVRPQDLAVSLYHHLGIDPETKFLNRTGRPVPIGSNGQIIPELFA